MEKILITGGCGFIGHHFVEHILKNTNWEIIIFDKLTYASEGFSRLKDISAYDDKRVTIIALDFNKEIPVGVITEIGNVSYIVHLGAETHVDNSIINPEPFVYSNVIGTMRLLDYARELKNLKKFVYFSTDEVFGPAPIGVSYKEWDRYNSTNPYAASKAGGEELALAYANTYGVPVIVTHCHDEETLCWAEKGIVPITELSIGDNVWTLKENKELKLEPIEEIVYNDYNGEMIDFNSNKFSFKVTPNHRMLTKKRYGENEYTIKYAKDLFENINENDRHYIPTSGEWIGLNEEEIDLSKYLNNENKHYNTNKIHTKFKTIDFMEFIGWFISEGSFNKKSTGCISIANTNFIYRNEIIDVIKRMGFTPSYSENTKNIQFHSVIFQPFLEEFFGRGCENKKIPKWILNYDKKYLECLFISLMKGDGTISKTSKRYYSKSKILCNQVAEIAIKLGYSCQVKERKTNTLKLCGVDKEIISYYTNIRSSQPSALIKKHISKSFYAGKIWCVRTKSGNFFISRNGNIACSGNTMNVFGERQHSEKFIPKVIKSVMYDQVITIHADQTKTISGSRMWIHARNVASAIHFLLHNSEKRDKYNIVGEKEVSNLDMAKYIALVLGKELQYEMVDFHSSRPGHDLRYALDGSKLKEMGWETPLTFEQSLKKTIEWTINNPKWL